jgi:hypothetical protein
MRYFFGQLIAETRSMPNNYTVFPSSEKVSQHSTLALKKELGRVCLVWFS